MWLHNLKIAVIEEDTHKLEHLIGDIPTFTDKEKLEEAYYLSQAALKVLHRLQDATSQSMIQIKKNIAFVNSAVEPTKSKLDITS